MPILAKIKELSADTLTYGMATVITRFISIFLVPIYTRIFSPNEYGVINLVNTTLVLTGILVVAGLDNAATRWYWDKEDDRERNTTFSSWFWTQFVFACFSCSVICIFSTSISARITGAEENWLLFVLAGLNLPFTGFILLYSSWLRVKRKAMATLVFTLLNTFLTIGLSIYLVVILKKGIAGVFAAQLISNAVFSILVICIMHRHLHLRHFNKSRASEMLKYSLPLVPAALAFWTLNSAGSYFINASSSSYEVGLFQIAASIASVSGMAIWAFLQAWSPFAMSIHKSHDAGKVYATVLDLYCSGGAMLVLFIFLFAPEVLAVLTTKQYIDAALAAGILCLNLFISNIAQLTGIGCTIAKTNKPFLHGVLIAALVSLVLFPLLIPVFGKEGAALSSLAGSCVLSIYVTVRAQSIHPFPYRFYKIFLIIGALLLCAAPTRFVYFNHNALSIAFKLALLLLFAITLFIINRVQVLKLINRIPVLAAVVPTRKDNLPKN